MAATIDGTTGLTSPAGGVVNPSTTVDGINYSCRAWVNFNGTGTVAIRASGNVSSITDNGTGDYTVNLTTAMPDINYAAHFSADGTNPVATANESDATTRTVSAIRMITGTSTTGALADRLRVSVSIFR